MLTVYAGCMGAGKTAVLIDLVHYYDNFGPTLALKPALDTRSGPHLRSRDGRQIDAVEVSTLEALGGALTRFAESCDSAGKAGLAVIDEGQFLPQGAPGVLLSASIGGLAVVVAGLDLDYLGRPFDVMAHLLAAADDPRKLTASCAGCGGPARFSYRKGPAAPGALIVVGGDELYEPLCGLCYRARPPF